MTEGVLLLLPHVVRAGARALSAAGADLQSEYRRVGLPLATDTGDRPWGRDDIGGAFDRNYRPIEQQALQAWRRLGEHIEALGVAASATVDDNQGADHTSAVRLKHAHRADP